MLREIKNFFSEYEPDSKWEIYQQGYIFEGVEKVGEYTHYQRRKKNGIYDRKSVKVFYAYVDYLIK